MKKIRIVLFIIILALIQKYLIDLVSINRTEYNSVVLSDEISRYEKGWQGSIDTDMLEVKLVSISFASKVKDDMQLCLDYANESGEVTASVTTLIRKGHDYIEIPCDGIAGSSFTVRTIGNCSIDRIEINGSKSNYNAMLGRGLKLLCIAIDAVLLFVLFRKEDFFLDSLDAKIRRLYGQLKINPYIIFAIYMLAVGIAFSLVMPITYVPDEEHHISLMTDAMGLSGFDEQYHEVYNLASLDYVLNYNVYVDMEEYKAGMEVPLNTQMLSWTPTLSFRVFSYGPAIIGLLLGILFRLPVFWCVYLADISNLLFATFVCILALKLMPIKKELFALTLALPMAMQQYASVNYDAVLLPLISLFIAYALNIRFSAKEVTWPRVILLGLLLIIIALIKPPYAFVGIMLFLIPKESFVLRIGKLPLNRILNFLCAKWYWTLLTIALLGTAALYVFRNVPFVSVFLACILNPANTFRIIGNTVSEFLGKYVSSLFGDFGWLFVSVPKSFIAMTIVIMLIFTVLGRRAVTKKALTRKDVLSIRIVFAVYTVVIAFLVLMSMMTHSFAILNLPYGQLSQARASITKIDYSLGVQGRYFIPILFTLFTAFAPLRVDDENEIKLYFTPFIYFILAGILPLIWIAMKFYAFY